MDAHEGSRLVPLGVDLVEEGHVAGIAILVGGNDAFEALRVVDGRDVGGVVAYEVVVELNAAWFLRLNHDVANLEENSLNLRVVVVEGLSTIYGTRALVGLQDDQELPDELLAFGHKILLVQVNAHVLLSLQDLKADDIALLLLVKELSEDIGTLSVRLAPFLGLSVEELQSEDTLAELVHDRGPKQRVNLVGLPAEKRVHIGKLAQIEATSIGAALLIRSRDGTELAVPGLSRLITRLVLLTVDGVSEG